MDERPFIIGISGESGVGKSTVAQIVALFFGAEDITTISTDDLHKWGRADPAWNTITHLNPDANNLELGDMHLQELSCGNAIYRSIYNHKTGGFNPPIKIEPQPYVIVEGLHAFYTDTSKELTDIKIFVDTDDDLRTHWKIIRDTEERGYKYNDVLDSINKRRADSGQIRENQIGAADIVIKIYPENKIKCLGDKSEKIDLEILLLTPAHTAHDELCQELCEFIRSYVVGFNGFVDLSELVGNDIDLCQDGGGNVSVKVSDKYMIVKSSGYNLKDVYKLKGYSVINYGLLDHAKINDDSALALALQESLVLDKIKRASMEGGMHVVLGDKYVLHLHPIYVTLLLCLYEGKDIVAELFSDLQHEYIDYVSPAFGLYDRVRQHKDQKVFLLENHGVIVSSYDMRAAYDIVCDLNNRAKEYIKSKCDFAEFGIEFAQCETDEHRYTFPDAAIFTSSLKQEILAASNYIKIFGPKIGRIKHLTPGQVICLTSLESEKYRQSM